MTDSNDADRDDTPADLPTKAPASGTSNATSNEASTESSKEGLKEGPKESKPSGRVAFDSRGNPIWEWQLQTGVYSRDVSTQRLKKLDLGDLSIAESAIQKQPAGLKEALGGDKPAPNKSGSKPANLAKGPGGGFNPYDNSSRPAAQSADPYARALARKSEDAEKPAKAVQPVAPAARRPAPATPPKKESMLSRLDQWFKDKRRPKDDTDYE